MGAPFLSLQWANSDRDAIYALAQTAFGLGTVLGSYYVGKHLLSVGQMLQGMQWAYLSRTVGYLVLPWFGPNLVGFGLATAIVIGLTLPAVTVTIPTLLQRYSRQVGLGRIFGIYTFLNAGFVSISIFFYGLLAEIVNIHIFFYLAAAFSSFMIIIIPILVKPLPSTAKQSAVSET